MATNDEITKALGVLAAAYPRFELPDATIRIYQRLLGDLDFDTLKAATLQCATVCTFFPTVAEIRAAAVELQVMAEGVPSDIEAWGMVVQEIQRVGSYRTPTFSHPLVDDVVTQLGWRNLCLSDNATADRARFMDAYANALKQHKRHTQMLPEVRELVEHKLIAGDPIKQLAAKLEKPMHTTEELPNKATKL